MDPGAHRLDYALFQLTPTRTRCDLVIFYGGKSEKLASGLFQPFVSHLKSVKDEISRGGYSITLRPPNQYAPWFTKSTFQRFVRFVSTPAVLERFVSIEKEILQIESSVQLEEGAANLGTRKSTGSLKKRGELEESDDIENENSKVKLQRLLETRVTLLRKQQAMAYARGLVAGFDIYNIDDLISFSDAFGASRLREASISFKDLYMKKHQDGLWIQEVAAVVASSSSDLQLKDASGIILTNETDVTNQKVVLKLPNGGLPTQAPMPLPNHSPQYLYSSLGHANQMPPYPGYPFPTMQSFPPHYPRNLQWPPNMDEASFGKDSNYHRAQKSSSRRKNREDKQIESSDSSSASDSDSDTLQERKHSDVGNSSKRNRKKSSRKVIIKNINYITPKKRDGNTGGVHDESFSDEEIDDGHSLRQKSGKAEEVLEISNESNSQEKNAFQSLLMRDEKLTFNDVDTNGVQDEHFMLRSEGGNSLTRSTLELNFEKSPKQITGAAVDPLVMMNGIGRTDGGVKLGGFQNEEHFRSVMERKGSADQDVLFLQRSEESGTGTGFAYSVGASESTITKNSRGEDWFVANHSENSENQKGVIKQADFDGDRIFSSDSKGVCVDDSFFIKTRPEVDDMYVSPWKTEINMDNDLSLSSYKENDSVNTPHDKHRVPNTSEPDDLYMILERNSNSDSAAISRSMDYGAEISFTEASRRCSVVETTDDANMDNKPASNGKTGNGKSNKVPGTKDGGKETRSNLVRRSLVNNRFEIKSKKSLPSRPIIQKSKLEKEEEIRKKMEELRIERQKRIAEKTAAGGFGPVAPKRVASDSKAAKGSIKSEKSTLHSTKTTLHL